MLAAAPAAETFSYTSGTNRLASTTSASGTRSIGYDNRGTTISETRPGGATVSASYDGYGRLLTYTRTGDPAQTNVYNGLDDRVSATSGSTTRHYVYDADGRVLGEYGTSATNVIGETIWLSPEVANDNMPFGGDDGVGGYAPLAVATGSGGSAALTWLHGNHFGVPVVFADANGTAVSPPSYTLPGFPGQMKTLGDLYYNRYRDYESSTGRYIQADPIGLEGGSNPYLYANANPLRYVDPLGLATTYFDAVGSVIRHDALNRDPSDRNVYKWAAYGGVALCALAYDGYVLLNSGRPRGYWPGDKGAEEWGRRNGKGKDAGRRKFHGIKQGDGPSKADDDYGVNSDTGDVVDPNGDSVGNLND